MSSLEPKDAKLSGQISFQGGSKKIQIAVNAQNLTTPVFSAYKGFVENNGFISINAANFFRQTATEFTKWQVVQDFGYTGKVLQASFQDKEKNSIIDSLSIKQKSADAGYDFYNYTVAPAVVSIFSIPTHPLNKNYSMRYAVSIDDGPVQLIDFRTFGRSEEWKQNVLRNRTEQKIQFPILKSGSHTLHIMAIDPGVLLDEIRIDLGGLKNAYSVIPETSFLPAP